MQSTIGLQVLRTFLVVLGVLAVIWGIYDMFGDGQQSSMGVKKIVGGLAFGSLAYFFMTWAIGQVTSAESQAGISGAINLPVLIHSISGLIW